MRSFGIWGTDPIFRRNRHKLGTIPHRGAEKRGTTMIIANSKEAKSLIAPEPYVRELKVLLSPFLQEGVEGVSVGMTILPPGKATSNHEHEKEVEVWLIITGMGEAIVGDEKAEVGPESAVFIEPKKMHQLVNTGEQELRMFWVYWPPGAEKAVIDGLHQ